MSQDLLDLCWSCYISKLIGCDSTLVFFAEIMHKINMTGISGEFKRLSVQTGYISFSMTIVGVSIFVCILFFKNKYHICIKLEQVP